MWNHQQLLNVIIDDIRFPNGLEMPIKLFTYPSHGAQSLEAVWHFSLMF